MQCLLYCLRNKNENIHSWGMRMTDDGCMTTSHIAHWILENLWSGSQPRQDFCLIITTNVHFEQYVILALNQVANARKFSYAQFYYEISTNPIITIITDDAQ